MGFHDVEVCRQASPAGSRPGSSPKRLANDRDCRVLSTFIRISPDSFALNIQAVAAMNCRVRWRAKRQN
jgi:hypothetical protein